MVLRIPSLALQLPNLDGEPRRAHSCVNVRHEEKALIDVLSKWWSARTARPIRQPDAISMLLTLALENPRADLPPGLVEEWRALE